MTRLVTLADLDGDPADTRELSVSARLEAELADGRRLVLLDGRGWTASLHVFWQEGAPRPSASDMPDIWATTSLEDIEEGARGVVGPDPAFGEESQEEVDDGHWEYLAEVLQRQGVHVAGEELRRLPHDVVVSERLRACIGRRPS